MWLENSQRRSKSRWWRLSHWFGWRKRLWYLGVGGAVGEDIGAALEIGSLGVAVGGGVRETGAVGVDVAGSWFRLKEHLRFN